MKKRYALFFCFTEKTVGFFIGPVLVSIFIFLALSPITLQAQNKTDPATEKQLKKDAANDFDNNDFANAYSLYSQLLSLYPHDPNYNYRFGACILNNSGDKKKALRYIRYALKQPAVDNLAYYYLGRVLHLNYQFAEAQSAYNKYGQIATPAELKKYPVARLIEMCTNGQTLLATSQELDVLRKTPLNFSNFFRAYNMHGNGGSLISEPDEFKSKLDKEKKVANLMYVTPDKSKAFFSSYGGDETKGKDIYVINKTTDGTWGVPQNLGTVINTIYDEDYPVYDAPRHTLYYSSKGHNSMGGYDIFGSVYNDSTQTWSEPYNLDFPVNTPDDDILLVPDTSGQTAYFASSRSSSLGKIDVYKIALHLHPPGSEVIAGTVYKTGGTEGAYAIITVRDSATNNIVAIDTTSAGDGHYSFNLPKGGKYNFTVEDSAHKGQSRSVVLAMEEARIALKQNIQFDGSGALQITNLPAETSKDSNSKLALQYIQNEAQMNVNVDTNTIQTLLTKSTPVKPSIAIATATTNNTQNGKTGSPSIVSADTTHINSNTNSTTNAANNSTVATNNATNSGSTTSTDSVKLATLEQEEQQLNNKAANAVDYASDKLEQAQQLQEQANDIANNPGGNGTTGANNDSIKKLSIESKTSAKKGMEAYQLAAEYKWEAAAKQVEINKIENTNSSSGTKPPINNQTANNTNSAVSTTNVRPGDLIRQQAEQVKRDSSDLAQSNSEASQEISGLQQKAEEYTVQAGQTSDPQQKAALLQQADDLSKSKQQKQEEAKENSAQLTQLHDEYVWLNAKAQKADSTSIASGNGGNNTITAANPSLQKEINAYAVSNGADTSSAGIAYNNNQGNETATNENQNPANTNGVRNNSRHTKHTHRRVTIKTSSQSGNIAATNTQAGNTTGNTNSALTQGSNTSITGNPSITSGNTLNTTTANSQSNNSSSGNQNTSLTGNDNGSSPTNANNNATANSQSNNSSSGNQNTSLTGNDNGSSVTNANNNTTAISQPNNSTGGNQNTSLTGNDNGTSSISGDNTINGSTTNYTNNYIDSLAYYSKPNSTLLDSIANTLSPLKTSNRVSQNNSVAPSVYSATTIQYTDTTAMRLNQTSQNYFAAAKLLAESAQETRNKAKTEKNKNKSAYLIKMADSIDVLVLQLNVKGDAIIARANSDQYSINANLISNTGNSQPSEIPQNKIDAAQNMVKDADYTYVKSTKERDSANNISIPGNKIRYIESSEKDLAIAILKQQKAAYLYFQADSTQIVNSASSSESNIRFGYSDFLKTEGTNSPNIIHVTIPANSGSSTVQNSASTNATTNQNAQNTQTANTNSSSGNNSSSSSNINNTQSTSNNSTNTDSTKNIPVVSSANNNTTPVDSIKNTPLVSSANNNTTHVDSIKNTPVVSSVNNNATRVDSIKNTPLVSSANNNTTHVDSIKNTPLVSSANNNTTPVDSIKNTPLVSSANNNTTHVDSIKNTPVVSSVNNNTTHVDSIKNTPVVSSTTAGTTNNNTSTDNTQATALPETATILKNIHKSAYSAAKPIPIDPPLPTGVTFGVQVGAFRNSIPPNLFKGFRPIIGLKAAEGYVRYIAGLFNSFDLAKDAEGKIRNLGYPEAFIVAFYNGQRISVKDAMAKLGTSGSPIVATSENTQTNTTGQVTQPLNQTNSQATQTITQPIDTASLQGVRSVSVPVIAGNTIIPSLETLIDTKKKFIRAVKDTVPPSAKSISDIKGLVYTVQVGSFSSHKGFTRLRKINQLYSWTDARGTIKYNSGTYNSTADARAAKDIIVANTSVKDAFVTAYYNGKRITIAEARNLSSNGADPVNTSTENTATIATPADTSKPATSIYKEVDSSSFALASQTKVIYTVRIATFTGSLPVDTVNKLLTYASEGIEPYKEQTGATAYYAGKFSDYAEATILLQKFVKGGFPKAAIMAYDKGKKISLQEALTITNK